MTFSIEAFRLPYNYQLELLIYRDALEVTTAEDSKKILEINGWKKIWINGIYHFSHFHSNTHEVLVVCNGHAKVEFGNQQIITVQAKDVIFIPAGVAHKNLQSSKDFLVVGGYPYDIDYDMCKKIDEEKQAAIHHVQLPKSDPIFGKKGPLLDFWVKNEI